MTELSKALLKRKFQKLIKEKAKLEKNLGGIKDMKDLPGIIFIIDTKSEAIAVAEARRCGIPIVAVVDTNCNPEGIDFPIPGNDDAIRAISLFTQTIANAVIEADNEIGLQVIENLQDEEEAEAPAADNAAAEEEVETVSLAAAIGKDDAADDKLTTEDYSDYVPEEKAAEEAEAAAPADAADEIVDADKYYED